MNGKPLVSHGVFSRDILLITLTLCLPLVWLIVAFFTQGLGINPVDRIIRELGVWGLRFLILGLCITPLMQFTLKPKLNRLRRPIGIIAGLYISLHLLSYMYLELDFDVAELWKDLLKRPFITLGMVAFLGLIPLLATSFNKAKVGKPFIGQSMGSSY
jgi:sulfoxide reductase heme-binding subunit YedZ